MLVAGGQEKGRGGKKAFQQSKSFRHRHRAAWICKWLHKWHFLPTFPRILPWQWHSWWWFSPPSSCMISLDPTNNDQLYHRLLYPLAATQAIHSFHKRILKGTCGPSLIISWSERQIGTTLCSCIGQRIRFRSDAQVMMTMFFPWASLFSWNLPSPVISHCSYFSATSILVRTSQTSSLIILLWICHQAPDNDFRVSLKKWVWETNAGRRGQRESLPTARPELSSKRKAAQAAVDAAAQALAQDDGLEDGEGFGYGDDTQGPAPYMPVLPPGMQTSAAKPQARPLFDSILAL